MALFDRSYQWSEVATTLSCTLSEILLDFRSVLDCLWPWEVLHFQCDSSNYRLRTYDKEKAGGGLMINRRGYENNQLAAAYRHNRRLMVAYGGG